MATRSTSNDQMGLNFPSASRQGGAEKVEMRCTYCDERVKVPEWYTQEGVKFHFCSRECRRAWGEEVPSFEVKLEKRYRLRGANWEIQAREARERDAFTCQVCGVTEEELGRQLDVHHKIPYRSFKSNVEANKLEHLISVCPACHGGLEAQLRDDLPLFRKP